MNIKEEELYNMEEKQIKQELIDAFSKLSANDKRDELNLEINKIIMLINSKLVNSDGDNYDVPFNYNSILDKDMTEDEFLSKQYGDIIDLKYNLILLIKYLEK